MAWHLAKLQLEPRAVKSIGECADTVGRLVELGGDVLNFRWLVLLGSRPPTLGLRLIVGLEWVVRVAMRSLPGLVLLTPVVGLLQILVGGLLAVGAVGAVVRVGVPAVVCCGGTCEKSESGEFLHIRIFFYFNRKRRDGYLYGKFLTAQ